MIVTITLSPGSLPGLIPGLQKLGHEPVESPLLYFRPPESWAELGRAIARIEEYPLLGLTSPRASMALARRLEAVGQLRLPDTMRVFAIGPTTAAPLAAFATVNAPAVSMGGEGLAESIVAAGERGPLLYPCGADARPEFPARLRAAGIRVDQIVVYRTTLASPEQTVSVLRESDAVVIGSHLVLTRAAEVTSGRRRPALVCLGQATAATARSLGWEPAAVSESPNAAGALTAIASL
jgi:uroporphyrinogen III methyltransferase / synthase